MADHVDVDQTLRPGSIVERYEVVRSLGEGGMARVWLVRHTTLGTLHALKILKLTGPSLRARFLEEGRAQSSLRHENIVRVSDVLEIEGLPALILDYIDGPDLAEWIVEHKPDPATAERVFRGILAGVEAAHRTGRVHRDLKPANVLMARQPDGSFVPKVADFGLTKVIEAETPGDKGYVTRQGLPMGTPRYMAPEQIRDASKADFRSDVFALGAILHELVAHEPTFAGDDMFTIFEAVKRDARTPLPSVTPHRLRAVIDRCLRSNPADRPADIAAVVELLDTDRPLTLRAIPASAAPLAVPTAVIGAALAFAFAGAVFVALGVALLFRFLDRQTSPTDPCAPDVVGVAQAPTVFVKKAGDQWLLRGDTQVYAEIPELGEVPQPLCVVPRATWVTLPSDPIRSGDHRWVEIRGDQLVAARPEEVAPEGGPPGACPKSPSGEHLGWYSARNQLIGPKPREGSTWTNREEKDVVDAIPVEGEPPGEVVCVLPRNTTVSIQAAPQLVGGVWWIPYVIP